MRFHLIVAIALGLAFFPAWPGEGADRGEPPPPAARAAGDRLGEPVFRASGVDFPQVTVRVMLLASEPIEAGPRTFEVTEDGRPIEGFFLASATQKSYLTLLLDRSSSIEPVVGDIKRSAARFLYSLPAETRISLLTFGSDADITCDFTTDRPALIAGIRGLRPWGGTALYDALFLACEQLYAHSDPRDLRTVVLFTDGRDETPALRTRMSIKSLDEVLKLAKRHHIRLIAVGMGSDVDREVLERIAAETEGWSCHAPTARELSGIYESISRQIRHERHFVLHYLTPSPARDGTLRQVAVRATLPGGVVAGEAAYEAPSLPGRGGGVSSTPPPGRGRQPQPGGDGSGKVEPEGEGADAAPSEAAVAPVSSWRPAPGTGTPVGLEIAPPTLPPAGPGPANVSPSPPAATGSVEPPPPASGPRIPKIIE